MKQSVTLAVVHANIVLYAFCYWLTNPVLPFLLKEQGAEALSFGAFQSLFNVVQLCGGLFIGDLQDRYSGATALSITQVGSAAVYFLMYQANSLEMLYFSRLPTIFQQSMQVAQACVSKASDGETRLVSLGRLSLSYSAGMVAGSFLSGRIAEAFGNRVPAFAAFAISLAIVVVNRLLLKDLTSVPTKQEQEKAKHEKENKKVAGGLTGYLHLLRDLRRVVLFLALMFSTRSLYEPVYSLTLVEKFKVKQSTMGSLMGMFAGIGFVSNVILLPLLLKVMSEASVTKLSILGGAVSYLLLSVVGETSFEIYIVVFCCMTLVSSMLYTLTTSYITRATPKAAHGQAIALSHSLRSVVGIGCPLAGSFLLKNFGGPSVALLNTALLVLSLLIG